MKQIRWDVFLNGKQINSVFFDEDMPKNQVRKSLIEHDGLNSKIIVIPSRPPVERSK